MTGFVPKEKLTAYQRWEVAAFDEAEQTALQAAKTASSPTGSVGERADQGEQTHPHKQTGRCRYGCRRRGSRARAGGQRPMR